MVLSIALAWTCALSADLGSTARPPAPEGGWSATAPVNMHAETAYRFGFARLKLLYRDERLPFYGQIYGVESTAGFAGVVPPWTGLATPPPELDGTKVAGIHMTVDLCGWPFLCLASTTSRSVAAAPPVGWGVHTWTREEDVAFRIPWIASRCDPRNPTRCLPMHPVWVAFALDSGVLSVPAALAFAIPAIRARRRRRSGRCQHCGYPVADAAGRTCSECGEPIEWIARAQPARR